MIPAPRSARPRLAALALALSLAPFAASPAAASPETLRRAVGNLVFGPVDIALSPVMGSRTVYNNIREIEDTTAVRVFYVIPGVAWNTGMHVCGGLLRTLTGALELVPGLLLLPFDADLDPLYAPADRGNALVDEPVGPLNVKFGINYVD